MFVSNVIYPLTSSRVVQLRVFSIADIPLVAKVPVLCGRDDKSISIKWPNIDIAELTKDLAPGWSIASV
jgi:hypothetical protein